MQGIIRKATTLGTMAHLSWWVYLLAEFQAVVPPHHTQAKKQAKSKNESLQNFATVPNPKITVDVGDSILSRLSMNTNV